MKDPAFLFYPNDYIGGTMGMTFEEKGAYIELLMLQFNRGHMTSDMIGQTVGQLWDKIEVKFIKDDQGLYYNERLEIEKRKRKTFVNSRKNNLLGKNQYSEKSGHTTKHMTSDMSSHMEDRDRDVNKDEDLSKSEKDLKTYSEFTIQESAKWINHILNCGYYKTVKIDEGKFQDDIDKLQRLDNLSPEDIILIREFLQEDFNNNGFSWTKQIGSPGKLRKRSTSSGRKFQEDVLLSITQTRERNLTPSERLYRDTMKGFNDAENGL